MQISHGAGVWVSRGYCSDWPGEWETAGSRGPRRTVIAPAYFSTVILFQKSSNIFIIVFRSILRKTTILLILVLQYKYQTISFIM